ncbi:MAG: PilZ domain-containing protein [Clostridia bacterium]|nr:PilZ domain-containing protein [Clostridia bacterium]
MSIITVNNTELFSVMQYINLVKIKFKGEEAWSVAPVLYVEEDNVVLIAEFLKEESILIPSGEETLLKFQRQGYEFLVRGETEKNNSFGDNTIAIKFLLAQKYYNLRKYMRFDTDLKADVIVDGGVDSLGTVKNISKGGAMVTTNADIEANSTVNIHIAIKPEGSFRALAKIMRKSQLKDGYSYGVQFVEISDNNLEIINNVITEYEKSYFKSLNILREYTKKSESYIDTKIAIFSNDAEESYEIREILAKLGAENYDIFHNFRFHIDFFIEEKPKIVIIDGDSVNDDVTDMIENIKVNFPNINVILIIPLSYAEKEGEIELSVSNTNILYKPLICNEFEQEVIKYL